MFGRDTQGGHRRVTTATGWVFALIVSIVGVFGAGGPALGDPPPVNVWEPIGPTLATVFTMTHDPADDSIVYAGTNFGGVYRSTDGGTTWTALSGPFSSDAIFGISIAPTSNPRSILVATQSGGLYRSANNGSTWAQVNTGIPTAAVRNVAYSLVTSARALAATSAGIYLSINGGVSWGPTGSDIGTLYGEQLLYDPVHAGTVYAGTLGAGVRRSTDGGATWQGFTEGIGDEDIVCLHWDTNNPNRLWAATPSGIFSRDTGDTQWTDWTLDLPQEALVRSVTTIPGRTELLASTSNGIFVLSFDLPRAIGWTEWYDIDARFAAPNAAGTRVHIAHVINYFEATTDFGISFAPSAEGMQNIFCGALATIDSEGVTDVYAGTGNDIRVISTEDIDDGSHDWTMQDDVGGAIFELASAPTPAHPGRIFAGTEGFGLLRTMNYGAEWSSASTGMVPRDIIDLEQSRGTAGTIYAGTDAGCFVSRDGGRHWIQLAQNQNPVPIVDVEVDPAFVGWVYYATADGRFFRSQNDGESFFHLWSCPPGDTIRQLDRAPFFEIYAILGSGAVYTSDDGGFNFFRRGEDDIVERALCVCANETRPWIAYVGTEYGGVYRTGTSGIEWEKRSVGMNPAIIYAIAVAPDDDATIIAGTKGAVYLSSDEGVQWSKHATGLPPNGVVSSITFDPNVSARVYAEVVIEPTEPRPVAAPSKPTIKGRPVPVASPLDRDPSAATATPTFGGGMYVSHDRGRTWGLLTTNPAYTDSTAICASRTEPGTILVGADLAGIGRTTNLGGSWTASSDGMTVIVLSVAVDPTNPQTVYAATFSSGIFRSTNGGDTWTNMGPEHVIVFHVAVDPEVPTTVYASTSVGAMRSDDSGASWRLAGQDTAYVITIAADPRVPDRVYIGSYTGTAYRSDDGGRTWLDISVGLPRDDINGIVVSAIDSTVYAATAESGIYRSHDGGKTWWPANVAALGGYRVTDLAIDSATDDLYVGLWGGGLRSTDHGDTWAPMPLGFGEDYPSSIAVMPRTGMHGVVFMSVLNEQGAGVDPGVPVVRSADKGNTWSKLQAGIGSHDAMSVATSSGLAPRVYLGAIDGVYRSDDMGTSWTLANGGLAGLLVWDLAVDGADKNRAFAATSAGLYSTTNGGANWTPVAFDYDAIGAVPLRISAPVPGRVYVGTTERGVFFSANDGQAWGGGITPELSVMAPHALAVNPSDRNEIWVATADQGVAVSRNRGETWAFSKNGLGAKVMFTITIDPVTPSTIYVTSQDAGIWVSVNGGASWSELNTGLTNKFVTAFAIDANDHKTVYAGTEGGGVFRLRRP